MHMATNTISAATLTALPDGRLQLGTEALSPGDSERLRAHLAYGDGTLPAHVGLRETPNGGREVWRIEDGAAAAIPVVPDPATPHASPKTRGGFGSARGYFITSPDFDDPLPDFAAYR